MLASCFKLLLLFAALLQCCPVSNAKAGKKQLKDVQLKIPLQIRARRFCTDADCVKTCPKDYELDSENQYCRYKRSICPSNYVRRHGSCVLIDVQCPPGSVRQGNRCVVKSLECPPGYVLEGNNCVNANYCPDGYHWENGFCYHQQRKQICPHGYESQNGICIQICINCDSACSECEEETVSLKCPVGYEVYRGKCLKILQGRADVVLRNVTYKVPVECGNDEIFSDGLCVSWKFDNTQCTSGHFYGGKCVEVAKCSRGTLHNDCECMVESSSPAICRQGQSSAAGCVVAKAQCQKPSQLTNGVCLLRKSDSHKAFCRRGTPTNDLFCDAGTPVCPPGYTLGESFCKRTVSQPIDCGRYQLLNGWCVSNASCDHGYKYHENGDCIRESHAQMNTCPPSTLDDGEHCVYNTPLCNQDHVYDDRFGMCVKCEEKAVICNEALGYHLSNGTCVRYEPVCPAGYIWDLNQCISKSEEYYECPSGFLFDNYCVHSHLNCPEDHDFVGDVCIKHELPICPEGSVYQNGYCVAAPQCPFGYTFGLNFCVEESRSYLNNSVTPSCPSNFQFESGNCVRAMWRNATVESRLPQCPIGYKLLAGKCTKEYHGLLSCPPKTMLMNQENKCFCKVDLVCPTGYERIGDECIFRSANYFSSFLNFLNPCYGIQCGMQYCLTQCFSPPCPVQPCSYGSYQQYGPMNINYKQNHNTDPCGVGESCTSAERQETIVSLVCPPGYNRENSSCVAYYERICQSGYKMRAGRCVKIDEVKAMCALGFTQVNATCIRVTCDAGYHREGSLCKKVEYRIPIPCQRNYVFVDGICLHRNDCIGGSKEGNYCVRRRYASFKCPQDFVQHNDTCISQGFCSTRDFFQIDNMCKSKDLIQLTCPIRTIRVKNMCVYPEVPSGKKISARPTNCNGKIHPDDLCAYVETPSCSKGFFLKNDKCVSCSSKAPYCPSDMIIIKGKCIKHRKPCNSGQHLNKYGNCVSVDIKSAACIQGTLRFGKCVQALSPCKPDYIMDNDRCIRRETVLPSCSQGFFFKGMCVDLMQCNGPDFTLINGLCIRNEGSEPMCTDKTTRVRDLCINGNPKCPENHSILNGHCYSSQVQPAECANRGKCSENFCSISYPSCNPSFNFDGSVCKKMISRNPKCPSGTSLVSNERSYCQYSSEHADFSCPNEYHFKNGICQKRQYMDASCPDGSRRKMDLCIRKTCQSTALTTFCGTYSLSQPNLRTIQQPGNAMLPSFTNASSLPPQQEPICCRVYSPRICRKDDRTDDWSCYHTENERCGPFCQYQNQRIYLRTAESYNLQQNVLILLPQEGPADSEEDDYNIDGKTDCEDCTDLSYDCSSDCYTFDCQNEEGGCEFRDQREFCSTYAGAGCAAKDGCYDRTFCVH